MSTVLTCCNPEEGWGLYNHFLGNFLSVISLSKELLNKEKDEDQKYRRERVIADSRAQLVGNLYMIMCRMKTHGYNDDAQKMQQIIDMVVELDITDPKVQRAIDEKHCELSHRKRDFNEKLKEIKARYEK